MLPFGGFHLQFKVCQLQGEPHRTAEQNRTIERPPHFPAQRRAKVSKRRSPSPVSIDGSNLSLAFGHPRVHLVRLQPLTGRVVGVGFNWFGQRNVSSAGFSTPTSLASVARTS